MSIERNRLTEAKEDYLETILLLSDGVHPVKSVDIAKAMGVSKASVSCILTELSELGYVDFQKYSPIFLTKKGKQLAEATLNKHNILFDFLHKTCGISAAESSVAACKIEHAITANIALKIADVSKLIDDKRNE